MRVRVSTILLLLVFVVQVTDVAGQLAGGAGVITVDGKLVQIGIDRGVVKMTSSGDPHLQGQATDIDIKLEQLTRLIGKHLAIAEEQEDRVLSEEESLYRATSYANKLVEKIALLSERMSFLGEQNELTKRIEAATDAFNVPEIKQLLQKKLALDDKYVAEAAFQLAGFQFLDGEYQDAWANYQKASNLHPENQLYMDAHGKNEF